MGLIGCLAFWRGCDCFQPVDQEDLVEEMPLWAGLWRFGQNYLKISQTIQLEDPWPTGGGTGRDMQGVQWAFVGSHWKGCGKGKGRWKERSLVLEYGDFKKVMENWIKRKAYLGAKKLKYRHSFCLNNTYFPQAFWGPLKCQQLIEDSESPRPDAPSTSILTMSVSCGDKRQRQTLPQVPWNPRALQS